MCFWLSCWFAGTYIDKPQYKVNKCDCKVYCWPLVIMFLMAGSPQIWHRDSKQELRGISISASQNVLSKSGSSKVLPCGKWLKPHASKDFSQFQKVSADYLLIWPSISQGDSSGMYTRQHYDSGWHTITYNPWCSRIEHDPTHRKTHQQQQSSTNFLTQMPVDR